MRTRRVILCLALVLSLAGFVPGVSPRAGADSGRGDSEPVNSVTACGVERWVSMITGYCRRSDHDIATPLITRYCHLLPHAVFSC
jgi:hypothetical protein